MTDVKPLRYKRNMSMPTSGPKQRDSKPKTTLDSILWISAFVPRISAFVPGISAFVFGAIVFKKMECCVQKNGMSQFTYRRGCKAIPQVAQGLKPPNQFQVSAQYPNKWICAAIYHGVATLAEILVRPRRPNKQATPCVLKIWRFWKNVFVSKNVSQNVLVGKLLAA